MAVTASKPVIVIFGSGKNIGAAVTKKFVEAGYRVAAVSRSATPSLSNDGTVLTIQADLSKLSEVASVLDTVRETWNVFPRVLVWQAARRSFSQEKGNMFGVSVSDLEADFGIANTSPWVVANEAVKNWKEGEKSVFIYTGNLCGKTIFPVPDFTTVGVSKRAASYWIEDADRVYKQKGWRFYFADERNPQGGSPGNPPGGESHADMFMQLAEGSKELPSYLTFAKGEYQQF